jgi:glycosyltransferase involved in cell wall biosynthesis
MHVELKILLVMDPGILVPPKGYGGHERLIYMFAKEYARLGHEVHLLVTKGSVVKGCTVHGYGEEGFPPKKIDALLAIPKAWWFIWKNRNSFDLIHNFGRLAYLLPVLNWPVKKIMTYGREISKRNILQINKFKNKNLVFTGCSSNLVSRGNVAGRWETVYNAIDFSKYTLVENIADDAPLMFLGRIERVKGCHTAIRIAIETGNRLMIGGNISPLDDEKKYFEEEIRPFIDGKQIVFLGPLDDEQKSNYLGQSKALLFPIEWQEPFGMVMVEAMACGTPVIAFRNGSVQEVVSNGKTGFVVDNFELMKKSISSIEKLNRGEIRLISEKKFCVQLLAIEYLNLFN